MPRETGTTPARARKSAPAKKTTTAPKTAKKVTARAGAAAKTRAPKPANVSTVSARLAAAEAYKARRARPTAALADMASSGLGIQLMATAHAYAQVLERALLAGRTTTDLTVPRLQLLQVIDANGSVFGAEAARAMGVRPQSLTYLLAQVSGLGWITEAGASGRGKEHVLTPDGRAALKSGRRVQARVEASFAQAFSHDGAEAQVLAKLLTVGRDHLAGAEAKK
jgi:DNA-binding MarR family transcriptional regulator